MKNDEIQKPELVIPEDFEKLLIEKNLIDTFLKLPYSHRREHLSAINDAKKPETRTKRILNAIKILSK